MLVVIWRSLKIQARLWPIIAFWQMCLQIYLLLRRYADANDFALSNGLTIPWWISNIKRYDARLPRSIMMIETSESQDTFV